MGQIIVTNTEILSNADLKIDISYKREGHASSCPGTPNAPQRRSFRPSPPILRSVAQFFAIHHFQPIHEPGTTMRAPPDRRHHFQPAKPLDTLDAHLAIIEPLIRWCIRAAGRWLPSGITPEEILAEADAISERHSLKGGHRAFDILPVAHAKRVGSKQFLSFDANQIVLAKAVGLAVGP